MSFKSIDGNFLDITNDELDNQLILRTLTKKTKLKIRKYYDKTVQDLIEGEQKDYLRWCYFNLEKISFTEDILKEIKIPKKYYINKPGINKELGEELEKTLRGEKTSKYHFNKYKFHKDKLKKDKS